MEFILYQVDAFADQLFKGNPAAVVPLDHWLPDETMQAVARENNLSETAFFFFNGEDYQLRWFTPTKEVKLCGHATLATAHVLSQHLGKQSPGTITFQTLSGLLTVRRNRNGWYTMNFPADSIEETPAPAALKKALNLTPKETYKGSEDLLVILEDQDAVEQLSPDFRKLQDLDYRGIIVSAPGRETDFASRCFFPNYGIDEDPVTGSAHTTLTVYWAKKLEKTELTAVQCSARSGTLRCQMLDERVEISGQAITYGEGIINVPVEGSTQTP